MADKSKAISYASNHLASIAGTTMFTTGESLKANYTWFEPKDEGAIGTDKPANSGRQLTREDVMGSVTVQPSYANANLILQTWMDETTGTFTPADTPNSKTGAVVIDRDVDIYTYAACWLNTIELSGSGGDPVAWMLDLMGTTEANAGTVTALTIPDRMRSSDLTLTMNANTYFPISFTWRFSYDLEDRFAFSQTRTSVGSRMPFAELEIELDENSDNFTDLMALAGTDTAMDDVNLTFTNGTSSLVIAHPEMCVMNESKWPDRDGAGAQQNTVTLRAFLANLESDIFTITYTA